MPRIDLRDRNQFFALVKRVKSLKEQSKSQKNDLKMVREYAELVESDFVRTVDLLEKSRKMVLQLDQKYSSCLSHTNDQLQKLDLLKKLAHETRARENSLEKKISDTMKRLEEQSEEQTRLSDKKCELEAKIMQFGSNRKRPINEHKQNHPKAEEILFNTKEKDQYLAREGRQIAPDSQSHDPPGTT